MISFTTGILLKIQNLFCKLFHYTYEATIIQNENENIIIKISWINKWSDTQSLTDITVQ